MTPTFETETPEAKAFGEAWLAICRIALNDRVGPMNELPGLWAKVVDQHWSFWVNGKQEPLKTASGSKSSTTRAEVPPYHVYVEYNGWPAGILGTNGGTIAAGEAANIFTFRDALKRCAEQGSNRGANQ